MCQELRADASVSERLGHDEVRHVGDRVAMKNDTIEGVVYIDVTHNAAAVFIVSIVLVIGGGFMSLILVCCYITMMI